MRSWKFKFFQLKIEIYDTTLYARIVHESRAASRASGNIFLKLSENKFLCDSNFRRNWVPTIVFFYAPAQGSMYPPAESCHRHRENLGDTLGAHWYADIPASHWKKWMQMHWAVSLLTLSFFNVLSGKKWKTLLSLQCRERESCTFSSTNCLCSYLNLFQHFKIYVTPSKHFKIIATSTKHIKYFLKWLLRPMLGNSLT